MGRLLLDTWLNGPGALFEHTSDSGAAWLPHSDYTGTLWRHANAAVFSDPLDTEEALYYANVLPTTPDVMVRVGISVAGASPPDNSIGIAYRIQRDDKSYYRVRHNLTNWVLEKVVNGAITQLASNALAFAAGDDIIITIMAVGSSHTVRLSNITAATGATLTATDSSIPDAGYFGLWGSSGGTSTGTAPTHFVADGVYVFTNSNNAFYFTEAGFNGADITMPQMSTAWSASIGTLVTGTTGDGTIEMPLLEVSGVITHIAAFSAELPLLEADIVGYMGYAATIEAELTQVEGALTGGFPGGAFRMPLFEVAGTILKGVAAAGTVPMPLFTVESYSLRAGQMVGAFTMPLLDVAATTLVGNPTAGAFTMPLFLVDAAGFAGSKLVGALEMPLFEVAGVGYGPYSATVAAKLMPITAYITAGPGEGSVVTVLAMNLRTGGVSEYTGWTFNSMMTWRGRVFGASDAGIFELAGETDDGTAIASDFRTCNTDFAQIDEKGAFAPFEKRPTDAYLSYQADEEMVFTVYADDEAYEYTVPKGRYYANKASAKARPHKTELGLGIESNYLQFGMQNRNGSDFLFDSVRALINATKRRV